MHNPNTVTAYSPEGEPFEMSRVNARDLCSHRGWSMSPLTVPPVKTEIKAETPAATKEEAHAEADSEGSREDGQGTEGSEADGTEGSAGSEAAQSQQEDVLTDTAIFTTEEQFAELTEREDVVAYLAKHFPDFRPHHKAGRDGLVAKAIELATGE